VTATEGSGTVRVVIVDDHPMVREGLRSMLSEPTIEVVDDIGTGEEAVQRAAGDDVDLFLLDMSLPDVDGVTLIERIKARAPAVAVLVVSMHDDPDLVRRAISAGAAGYVLKEATRRELLHAVHAVLEGESVLGRGLLREVLAGTAADDGTARLPADPLTSVETDVLRLLASGLTNKEISERLHWSVGTVKKYVQRILMKLQVSDRTQAAVLAVRRGLVG
jgi:DNA-binding NarL/FixJ family response regulator